MKWQLEIVYSNPTGSHLWSTQTVLWVKSLKREVQAVNCDMLSTQIARERQKMFTQANILNMNLDPFVNLRGTPITAFLYWEYGSILTDTEETKANFLAFREQGR